MKGRKTACRRSALFFAALAGALLFVPAGTAAAFNPIVPTKSDQTVTLTGNALTIEQVVDVARYGAKVRLAQAARRRSEDAYELLLEGARQGIPIYGFNRGSGAGRETVQFEGDPLSPENREFLLARELAKLRQHSREGIGPEVADEEIVRAMMAVRANTMVYEAASPQLTQMLLDLLNNYISPVVQSRGSPGEGDLSMMGNVGGTMVGAGQAYLRGQRMPAREALEQAGLEPLVPFADDARSLWSTNAYSAGQAVLLLHDTKRMLDWSDLTFAMSMLGLNSSVTPLTAVPQEARPFAYQNSVARRLLNLVRGSYLFEWEHPPGFDGRRIIQDPLSFRDYSQRNGALWQAYARLKKNILIQINSSDHNPAVVPGSKPSDSWELNTPWLRRYFVEKGEAGVSGFILSNANFVALPWGNDLEAFTIALSNALAAHVQRVLRFQDTFFTVVAPRDVLSPDVLAGAPPAGRFHYVISDLMAEIQTLANPVPAQGNALIENVEDMETFTRLRVARARLAVDDAVQLVAQELLAASFWMEVRKAQNPDRSFAAAPVDALRALRGVIPWQQPLDLRPEVPPGALVAAFMNAVPAATFMGADAAEPTAVRARTFRAIKKAKAKRRVLRRQTRERTPGPQVIVRR
jgi:histidine ammonia-lyase